MTPTKLESSALANGAAEEVVVAYHERSKHHRHRYAASLGYMDWASQPDPFRRYDGAPLVQLPLPDAAELPPFWQLYVPHGVPAARLSLDSVSRFFRYALSLTAWKELQSTSWSLRANPSSGNLHPTEGYALLPPLAALHDSAGLYHYAAKEHGLERRAELAASAWAELAATLPKDAFLVGLSSIHWREAWKYGERAFRYCQHDVGHALGSMRYAAAALGWRLRLEGGVDHASLARLFGLDRDADYAGAEREHAALIALVLPGDGDSDGDGDGALPLARILAAPMATAAWHGSANVLSAAHPVDWPVIDEVALATTTTPTQPPVDASFCDFPTEEQLFTPPVRDGAHSAAHVILGRRSAVSMDGTTSIPRATFYRMLARLVPTADRRALPWDALPWRPRIQLALFVHRIDDLTPGLYALARDPAQVEPLRLAMSEDFHWHRPPACPPGLPLHLLKAGDCRDLAAEVSCGQAIAGDGAFSLGMLADTHGSVATHGAGFYRNLFWEAGLVGHALYLEAEEAGIRSTGIGCYFDDLVHQVFGLSSRDWQSLYHFTVGGPVDDPRLTTRPGYSPREAP